ncbi:MAG: hypothetical protein LBD17_02175 [Endomicrobium sp.]|jgi:hypothetical protein|nr:hypothetical protein [Endomicrobium sp.]
MVKHEEKLANNSRAYAHLGVDINKKSEGYKNLAIRYDPIRPLSDEEFEQKQDSRHV